MNVLEQLSSQGTMVLISAATLLEYLHADREETFMEGVRQGRYQAELAAKASAEKPYTKKQAADVLGFSEGTVDNLRRRGELASYEYGGQVRIEKAEVQRWKDLHKNLYNRTYNTKKQRTI